RNEDFDSTFPCIRRRLRLNILKSWRRGQGMAQKTILSREERGGAVRLGGGLGGVSVAAVAATGARAEQYKIGDVDVTVSGAVTAGTEVRTTPRDPRLIFARIDRKMGVPATATSVANQDDGNLNYAPGLPVSSV